MLLAGLGRDPNVNGGPITSKTRAIGPLITSLLLCFGAATIGGAVTGAAVANWYPDLRKPSWTPPPWVFGPVWTLLYTMMAVAAWLVWRRVGSWRRRPLVLFSIQLFLNLGWSLLFFGLQQPGFAFAEILALLAAIGATFLSFARHSRLAAALLIPYLLWVAFASALNLAIWQANR